MHIMHIIDFMLEARLWIRYAKPINYQISLGENLFLISDMHDQLGNSSTSSLAMPELHLHQHLQMHILRTSKGLPKRHNGRILILTSAKHKGIFCCQGLIVGKGQTLIS